MPLTPQQKEFIHYAETNQNNSCQKLLENGFNDIRSVDGIPLILEIFKKGNLEVVEMLVDLDTAFHDFSDFAMTKFLADLLKLKCTGLVKKVLKSANRKNFFLFKEGILTPILFLSSKNRCIEIYIELKKIGARFYIPWNYNNSTPLMWCKTQQEVEFFLKEGVSINTESFDGQTALSCAILRRNEPVAMKLLTRGADPNIKPDFYDCILSIACRNCSFLLCSMLVSHGAYVDGRVKNASVSKGGKGMTPLEVATEIGEKKLFDFLKEKGAKE